MRATDIVVKRVSLDTEDFLYRTPIKFGGVSLDRVTLLNTTLEVEASDGKRAVGKGSMPIGNVWAFPSKSLSYDQTLAAMRSLAGHVARIYEQSNLAGHPIEISWQLESDIISAANHESQRLKLGEPIPALAALVIASPFDAALHDAYGKLHDRSAYRTYGKEFLENDLGRFFGPDFQGVWIDQQLTPEPVAELPLYHLVGALDPLTAEEVAIPVADGLPETLGDWIVRDGLTHLKIKLNGDDLDWDLNRILGVEAVSSDTQAKASTVDWHYSLDFNEKCRSVDYLLEFIARVKKRSPAAYDRIAYIEQPTARDLKSDPGNKMNAASQQIPVVIDESLIDLESLLLAREMGYTGVALKACKGQSQSILLACAARHLKMFLCVQDLTCPGASLIHSAGLAAHIKGVTAIEANSRQYCPNANAAWSTRFPGVFEIRNGRMQTGALTGLGLGAYPAN